MVHKLTKNKICFCLTGWHFHEVVYRRLCDIGSVDIFVIVHRDREQVPPFVFEQIPESHLIFRENIGYDWGSYQQFLTTKLWLEYEVVFFMHDDLMIKNLDFLPHAIDLLDRGKKVVGNGRNSQHLNWPQTHLFCYGHSSWLPPNQQFQHDTVRGSFFAIKSVTLDKIKKFEIFWDPHHLNIRYGNHSLIATCGRIQSFFGDNSFGFLSENYLDSPYIVEIERGGKLVRPSTHIQRAGIHLYNKLSSFYVTKRMDQSKQESGQLVRLAGLIIRKISGVF
jgi:hypothetical protein